MNKQIAIALIVCALIAVPMTAVADNHIRDAELAIDQPPGVEGDISQRAVNGTTQYIAAGSPLELKPRNFDPENVVNAGSSTPGGELRYDEQFQEYVFSAEGKGTYELFWVVSETVVVDQAQTETPTNATGNATGNGTQQTVQNTTTAEVQVRYEAQIRVRGQTDIVAVEQQEMEQLRTQADKWAQFNATVQELRNRDFLLRPNERTTDQTIQGMIEAYITTGNPVSALSGNMTAVLILMGTTIGGALVAALWFGYTTVTLTSLRGRLNRFETAEAEEGDVSDRQAELSRRERIQAAANMDFQDVDQFDDYWAQLFRELHGENVRDGWESILYELQVQMPLDWLAIMGQNGYVAVVPDGDEKITVCKRDDTRDSEWVVDLADLDPEHVPRIDMTAPPVATFDMATADIDWNALETATANVTVDIEAWADEWDADLDDADLTQYGEMLVALCEAVDDHQYTDADGEVKPQQAYLNAYLEAANTAEQYSLPGAPMLRDLFERAIHHYNPTERTQQTVEDIREGRYTSGDD